MVNGIHCDTSVDRLLSQPAITPGLADGYVFVLHVADLPDGGHAINQYFAGFAGGQLNQGIIAFFGHKLGCPARRAHHLGALAGLQFYVVDRSAGGNVLQRQSVANQNVSFRPAYNLLSHLEPDRLEDIAFFTVQIRNQCDARRAVGIVLNGNNLAWDAGLVALEINDPQLALVSAPAMPDGDVTGITTSAGTLPDLRQRLVRPVGGQLIVG